MPADRIHQLWEEQGNVTTLVVLFEALGDEGTRLESLRPAVNRRPADPLTGSSDGGAEDLCYPVSKRSPYSRL